MLLKEKGPLKSPVEVDVCWKLMRAEVDCIFMGELLQELQLSANHLGSALLQRNM